MINRKLAIIGLLVCLVVKQIYAESFVTFESDQFRPLAISPDGNQLFMVNTPDNRLEIFDLSLDKLIAVAAVSVGLEPVAVAARSNDEVWVVNRLSDSVSIVDLSGSVPRVVRTLLVGDEPADIVFAGPGNDKAFITAAHRGQNSPYADPVNPGELITPGIGRADVWVFDATDPGSSLGGNPVTIVTLFGDTPGPMARSPDGSIVYAGIFKSGNRTTTLNEGLICNGGAAASPCTSVVGEQTSPGGLPAPNVDSDGMPQPEAGLIVKFDGAAWRDELNRDWSDQVRFNLPDLDVFAIDAAATTPAEIDAFSGVGTILYGMAVNPVTGLLYVSNTDANNAVRFEGTRPSASAVSTVQGNLHKARITVIDPAAGTVTPRHLNKHIDYSTTPAPAGVKDDSLAIPQSMALTSDGGTLYLAAKGSGKIGVFDLAKLEDDSFVPSSADHISLTGGGPTGLLLDEARDRLYVLTRFDNSISVIDTISNLEINHHGLFNPEPMSVVTGRPFLYDANLASSNGEASCGTCHVGADKDELAWDLGDPEGSVTNNPNIFTIGPVGDPDFHPLKGPMTTQTLRGMATHGPMHWRGDRSAGNDPGGDVFDEEAAFKKFNPAFVGLLGRDTELTTTQMDAFTDFILQVTPPPNPIRNLDNSLTASQSAGETFFLNVISDTQTCNGCHVLNPAMGFFGTNGNASFEAEPQHMKIPHLRNMYEKVGMFGMPAVQFFMPGDNLHQSDQIRGFGFTHDGSTDTLFRFLRALVFSFNGGDPERRQVEQFMLAFDSDLKPVVGQQVTLTSSNGSIVDARIDLLIAQANATNADLIVKGLSAGEPRGWQMLAPDVFASDKAGEATLSDEQMRGLAQTIGQELTYIAVPPGSGSRIGVDRDEDGVLDGDDNCPGVANAGQSDSNGNGLGDECDNDADVDGVPDDLDNCITVANGLVIADAGGNAQLDSDDDGFGNACDADLNNDLVVNGLDVGPFTMQFGTAGPDADFNGDGIVNGLDVGTFVSAFGQPPGPSAFAP
jgi:DNA-binding beta-propeller fold protein YncE